MKVIKISEMQDGMIVVRPCVSSSDIELIPSGTEIVKRFHHEVLARWGIDTLEVEDCIDYEQEFLKLSDEQQKKIQLKLQLLYVNADESDPFMSLLKSKTRNVLVKQALSDSRGTSK